MHQLIIHKGSVFHKDYVFDDADSIVLGRARSCDVFLPDANRRVSRQHAVLLQCPDRPSAYFVRDLGSLRGTRLNGEIVYSARIRDGDILKIAEYDLVYSSHAPAEAERVPLRVVGHKSTSSDLDKSTAAFERQEFIEEVPLSGPEREVVETVLQARTRGELLPNVLRPLLPATTAVCGARRAFAALFSPDVDPFEVTERAGLVPGEQIEITDENYLERLHQGRPVHEGQTLLVPIVERDRTVGFFCMDRGSDQPAFGRSNAAFLLLVGRLAATRPENGTARLTPAPVAPVFDWPSPMVGRSKQMRDLRSEIREAARDDSNVLLLGESGTGKEVAAQML